MLIINLLTSIFVYWAGRLFKKPDERKGCQRDFNWFEHFGGVQLSYL
jgi:hypothetical protein